MSGLAGIFNLDGGPVDPDLLAGMTQAMIFRGPDASGEWICGNLGLTHTLLRTTVDSDLDRQPLLNETGQICLVLDGRIDDRVNLIASLKSEGIHLRNLSDAELVLGAYQAWEEDCPARLIGDFAFAIWDGRKQQLFCARDPLGVKPFFYARFKNTVVFGNTIQALRLHPELSDELNENYLGDFLLFTVQQDRTTTAFRDLLRLAPGHCLCVSSAEFRLKKYWQLPDVQELKYKRPEDYVRQFRELLSVAVGDRLRTGRVSVLMSGGLDSPSISATARQIMDAQDSANGLRAYCIHHSGVFDDPEREFADIAARHLKIPLEFLDGSSVKLYSPWQGRRFEPPEPMDLPLAELFLQELQAVSTWGRVVLTGYDGDALFETNLGLHLRRQLRSGKLGRLAQDCVRYVALEHSIPPVGFRSFLQRRRSGSNPFRFYPPWLNPDFERRCNLRDRWLSVECKGNNSVHSGIQRMGQDGVWPAMLEGYDPGQTQTVVEYRHPLADLRLVRFCLSLPPIPWCLRKRLIRVAMKGMLPDSVLWRPKTPLVGHPEVAALKRNGFTDLPSVETVAAYVRTESVIKEIAEFASPDDCRLHLRPYSLAAWLASPVGQG